MTKVAIVLGLALSTAVGSAQTSPNATGHWEGEIQIPDHVLGLTVDLARSPSGVWIGSVSIPRTTTVDVPLDDIAVDGTAVRFTASLPGHTRFEGTLSADAKGLMGTVSNEMGGVPFQLTRNGEADVKVPPPSSTLTKEFEGTWEGALGVDGKVTRIVLKLSPAADGTATAMLINLDQGNEEIPVTTVTLHDKQLQLEARVVSGTYHGTLGASGDIAGEWAQGPARLPLTFKHGSSVSTP
jgi:hypothetical protein